MTWAFNLGLAGYSTALLLAAVNLFSPRRRLAGLVTGFLAAGALAQLVYLKLRWLEAGRPPLSNMYESMIVMVWAMVLVYLVVQRRFQIPALGLATAMLAVGLMAFASSFGREIKPLMPALRSNWLIVHVLTCMVSYGAFLIGCVAGIGFLATKARRASLAEAFETIMAKSISFGFLFLSLGIITGAVWANQAWGTYWQWDPKETWSLITWFVYAVFLHCRYMRGWRGSRAAWISILGFASVIFTYYGVNYLLSGLHSYANP